MAEERNEKQSQAVTHSTINTLHAMQAQMDILKTLHSTTRILTDQQEQHNSRFEETMTKVLQSTMQIYQTILQFQDLPPQVMRQQPVYLLDAKGYELPFYLEFITSRDVSYVFRYITPILMFSRLSSSH
jgi:hypothetical protein